MSENNQPEIEIYTLEWCPYCNKAKSFLKSKGLSFQEYYIDEAEVKREMIERTGGAKTVPQIFIDDQLVGGYDSMMEMKQTGQLQELLPLAGEDNFSQVWDVIIIGAGPAGLNAALYGARKGLDILIVSEAMGGQMVDTGSVENYLGFSEIMGPDLLQTFWEHVQDYEVEIELGEKVVDITKNSEQELVVKTNTGNEGQAKAVIVATGTTNRELNVPGEKQLKGRGVHYCATCDGHLYAGEPVAVVGGGNAGLEAALDLANIGCEVDLLEIQEELTGDQVLQDKVNNREAVNIHTGTGVEEIKSKESEDKLESLVVADKEGAETKELEVEAVFIEIGLLPNSEFIEDTVEVNEIGEIIIDENNQTSEEGIWAAGDVTDVGDKQIIVSAAEGAKAALRVNEYLS